jgi:uncharacterized membrane protein
MREWLVMATEYAIVVIDAIAFLTIVLGTFDVCVRALVLETKRASHAEKRSAWLRYARFLVVGLTFQLASDIIETSISASWEAIARLAAIAVIRTFLEYFLGRDVTEVRERQSEVGRRAASEMGHG